MTHGIEWLEANLEADHDLIVCLVQEASAVFGVNHKMVFMKDRKANLVLVRNCVFSFCSRRLFWGPVRTAKTFEMDHSTVLHGIDKFSQWCETNERTNTQGKEAFRRMECAYLEHVAGPVYREPHEPQFLKFSRFA